MPFAAHTPQINVNTDSVIVGLHLVDLLIHLYRSQRLTVCLMRSRPSQQSPLDACWWFASDLRLRLIFIDSL